MSALAVAASFALWAGACGSTDGAAPINPCTADKHCVLDDAGQADCESGYTWADPDDPNNLECVAVVDPNAGDAGAQDGGEPIQNKVAGPRPFACGDGTCAAPWETAANCAVDCAPWKPVCGDGSCDQGETCGSCSQDCGACKGVDAGSGAKCGDYVCASTETCETCPTDCGSCMDGGGGGPGSCQGKCGKYDATSTCQCDASCKQYSDCCSDFDQVCP